MPLLLTADRPAIHRRPVVSLAISWPAVAVAVCLLAGVGLRLGAYARNPALWGDEAMLALNVVHRPVAELFTPLDLNQGAPAGYLVGCRLLVQAFGGSEWVLRAPSIAAGLVALALFVPLAYRLLPVWSARLALGLIALSPYLVAYSAEFKQYELDACLTVGLVALGRPAWGATATRWQLARLALAGAAAVWFSHPAAFVLGGLGAAMLGDAVARRDRVALINRLIVCGIWAVGFAACFLLITRKLGANPYLLDYWAGAFWPLPPAGPGDVAWVVHHVLALFDNPGGFAAANIGAGGLAAACAAVGAIKLADTDRRLLAVLVGPIVLALVASAVHKYPFAGRLMLFAVPLLILLVAHGAAVLGGLLSPLGPAAGKVAAAAVVGTLFVPVVAENAAHLKRPLHAEETRAGLAHVAEHWQAGDQLVVTSGAGPAVGYYAPRFPVPAESTHLLGADRARFRDELARVPPGRLWVLMAHCKPADEAALRALLGGRGGCVDVVTAAGATVVSCEPAGG